MRKYEARLGSRVTAEFLRSQVEVGTRVCRSVGEARGELAELRSTVAEVADQYDLAPIAASTHPFADWHVQQRTEKDRYSDLERDLQSVARRLLICGMHVHVCIDDEDMRTDLMNQIVYFLPHLLALSTSSPFWQGEDTGLMSYRLTVFDALPRTGLPDPFDSYGQYERFVRRLVNAGLIEDATKIWWDVRPSAKFPTLEMRSTDVCTRLDDAITIAAMYQCFLRLLFRLRRNNQRWRIYPRTLVLENRWLAQRYGPTGNLVDFGLGEQVPFADLIDEVIDLLREDADALGCIREVEHARDIVARGTSAQHQVEIYNRSIASGADVNEALQAVVDWLVEETVHGIDEVTAD